MRTLGLKIDNDEHPASDGRTFARRNPITGSVVTTAAAASPEDGRIAVESAALAFPAWSATGPGERRRILLLAAKMMSDRVDDFIASMSEEIGATAGWAGFNVKLASNMLLEAAAATTRIVGEAIPSDRPGTRAFALRRPLGVVLAIAPWNAPVILGVRAIATALACGNTAILKSSELCPRTHQLIVDCLHDAGLPPGVLNALSNAPEDAAALVDSLIAHPAVRHVNFTGSTRVGRIIAESAGRHLKPVLLELGGKAPFLVLDDADLDSAVSAAAFGAFMNQGQICMSTERIIVHKKIAAPFVKKLAVKTKSLVAGDPRRPDTLLGSVVDEAAAKRVEELVADAVEKGARLVAGGSRRSTLVDATLLDGVTSSMRIYSEESFGPVVSVIHAEDDADAVRIANDTEYGLTAAVFSSDLNRARRIADGIESGICHINGPTVHDEAQMPFGGVKASGYGRFGGAAGIEAFTQLRWVTEQESPLHFPL